MPRRHILLLLAVAGLLRASTPAWCGEAAEQTGPRWWSLRPLSQAEPPPAAEDAPQAWRSHPIDRFVYAQLASKGLQPNPPADRGTLIRRLTYDLIGLPPTPEEVEAFVNDPSPQAYEQLVERLLASPYYGERWGRHWLDVVRFGESNGFERNVIINTLWPFRDYIIRSFNQDKPFDQLILEHLAGDVVGSGDPAIEIGTAFLVCGPYDNVGNQDPAQAAQIRANTIDDMIRATSEAFLGFTVGCARCHDHKFDPVMQADYYRMYATFAGVQHAERTMATPPERERRAEQVGPLQEKKQKLEQESSALEETIFQRAQQKLDQLETRWTRPSVARTGTEEILEEPQKARFIRLVAEGTDANPSQRTGFRIDEFEVWSSEQPSRNVALAANGARAEGNSRQAEDFAEAYSAGLAIDGKFGAQWIAAAPELTIILPSTQEIERIVFSSDRSGVAQGQSVATFVSDYRIEVSDDGEHWAEVANSHDRQPVNDAHRRKRLIQYEMTDEERQSLTALEKELETVQSQLNSIPALPSWWAGTFEQINGPFHVFIGGNPQKSGETVQPSSLSMLEGVTEPYKMPSEDPEGQRRLALARWIAAQDNPLTPRVLANRVWHYHFGAGLVSTPSDFGALGGEPTHPQLLDWAARQLLENGYRFKPLHKMIVLSQTYQQSSQWRREGAEVDADSRLLWRFPPRRLGSEEIRDAMLTISGQLDRRMGGPGFRLYRYLEDNVATYVPLNEHPSDTYRRAIYHQNARAAPVDLLSDFDGPDCAFPAPQRSTTTTPLQALTLLNHDFTLDMAAALAERLKQECSGQRPATHIGRAFMLAYSREPTEEELRGALGLVEAHGMNAFCRALLNSSELIYID